MTPEQFRRMETLFAEASRLPPEERGPYLDEQCGDDMQVRLGVEQLLLHDTTPHELFTVETTDLAQRVLRKPLPSSSAPPPEAIDGHRIVEVLGSGGMAFVYRAEREDLPEPVALKVLRPELASSTTVKRFKREIRVLRELEHPGIARLLDAGTTETGDPYFTMEYVSGESVTKYAGGKDLDLDARLDLLVPICDAVQHAHEHGVIHRDLKPDNILVDETGQPRILDFGVARAVDTDLRTSSVRTEVGQLLGTILYMSPEQLVGDPESIDARCDVYALGVIAYELLAGRLPHDVTGKTLAEAARLVREEPPAPMNEPGRVTIPPALEAIIIRMLQKDPARRYASAVDVGSDIERFRRQEPVDAPIAGSVTEARASIGGRPRSRWVVTVMLVLLLAAVIVLAVLLAQMTTRERPDVPPPPPAGR